MIQYHFPVDFSDVAQLIIFRCEGVQDAIDRAATKYNLKAEKAEDGVTLSLSSDLELTDAELQDINETIQKGWQDYLGTNKMQQLVDALCEWEFRIKLEPLLKDGWEIVPNSIQIIPTAGGSIERWFVVVKKECSDS